MKTLCKKIGALTAITASMTCAAQGVGSSSTLASPAASNALPRTSAPKFDSRVKSVVQTHQGIAVGFIEQGKGVKPAANDSVRVHYRGQLADGTEFDSSHSRGAPATFPLNRVIPCWTQALQLMSAGSKAQVICPAGAAYGERGIPGKIPPGAQLTFEVELLEVVGK